jgi:hypothetical protein
VQTHCVLLCSQRFCTPVRHQAEPCHATYANATLELNQLKIDPNKTSETSKLLKSKPGNGLSRFRKIRVQQQPSVEIGGARRDRTDDLLRARQALSQLSYGPSVTRCHSRISKRDSLCTIGRAAVPQRRNPENGGSGKI